MVITTIRQEEEESLTSGPESLNLILPNALSTVFHASVFFGHAIL